MTRVVIADDESLARDTIRLLLKERPEITVVAETDRGVTTLAAIKTEKPDIVFLDIQMPDGDGFSVLEALTPEELPVVIFVTAYDQYAVKAFDFHALDYLLKPYDDDRFFKALDRAIYQLKSIENSDLSEKITSLLAARQEERKPQYPERFSVRTRNIMEFIPVQDIDWIEAAGDYVVLHVANRSHLLRETMERMTSLLDPQKFVRVHRSSILAIEKVKAIQPHFNGAYIAVLTNNKKITISRRYWGQVEPVLNRKS
ncbi:MAG: response regulator transcription factor [Bacteroidetes Order II. Incertae sedis bacterium]|nr:response regulator transcription factor [Bacteroidetes Order II. bacterium]